MNRESREAHKEQVGIVWIFRPVLHRLRGSKGFVFSNSKYNLYKSSRSIAVMAIAFAPINNRS